MDKRFTITFLFICLSLYVSAQIQTWQWVRSGGSNSDNDFVEPAVCKIAGCDAFGNVYGLGMINGPNMNFDTFSSSGSYSVNNVWMSYLLFGYDCSGNMRWAKEIGDESGNVPWYGAVTDPQGNTYLAANFTYAEFSNRKPSRIYPELNFPNSICLSESKFIPHCKNQKYCFEQCRTAAYGNFKTTS